MDSLIETKLGSLYPNIKRGERSRGHRQLDNWNGKSWESWLESEKQKDYNTGTKAQWELEWDRKKSLLTVK